MMSLVVVVTIVAVGYGIAHSGIFGALTGLVAGFGIGGGLLVAVTHPEAEVASRGPDRVAQRIGGIAAAGAVLLGILKGGWNWGWAWGLAGYAVAIGLALLLAVLLRWTSPKE